VGDFYSYITGDAVCKYYTSTEESNHELISFKSIFYNKSKAFSLHAMEALGGRGYLLLIYDLGTRWG
jgi:hypothetical protein